MMKVKGEGGHETGRIDLFMRQSGLGSDRGQTGVRPGSDPGLTPV